MGATIPPRLKCRLRPRARARVAGWRTANMAEERLIRKYANRRLYDAHDSRHVTLDDLRKLIAGGQRIKVVDDKSGDDITRSILLQIIASQEQFGTPVLSLQLLEAIIRFYGNPIQQRLTSYLDHLIPPPPPPPQTT